METTKEFSEELTLIKMSCFEDKWFYIFQNTEGEFRTLESDKFVELSLQPGDVVHASMRKRGCAGREIMDLQRSLL
ncbi:MAG: hypothetical protein Q8909_14770 [Bacteroidota bacterium]|nr:hypothetical protein [Bacteroidota bacterium]